MTRDLGLAIDIYQPFRDFEAMPEPQRARNLDRAERKFDVMQALGTDLILVCSNTLPGAIDDEARAAGDLAEMAERAARRGLRVGFEALSWGRHVSRWNQGLAHCAAGSASGARADCGQLSHLGTRRRSFGPRGRAGASASSMSSLRTRPACRWTCFPGAAITAVFPGQGDLDVVGFVRAVLASGLCGADLTRGVQRSFPGRAGPHDRARRAALARAGRGTGGRRRPAARASRAARRRVPGVCGRRGRKRGAGRSTGSSRFPARRPAPLESGRALPAGAHQPRAQRRARFRCLRAFPPSRPVGLRHRAAG